MTKSTSSCSAADPSLVRPAGTKRPLRRLLVDAELCPRVFERVLQELSRRALIPYELEFGRGKDGLSFSLAIDFPTSRGVQLLAAVRAIREVRSAELL